MAEKHAVMCQKWEERERGWGRRPFGYSLHLSKSDVPLFVKRYWDSMPDEVQDEYISPDGDPYWVVVDEDTYEKVKEAKGFGKRFSGQPPERDIMEILLLEIQCLVSNEEITGESYSEYAKYRLEQILCKEIEHELRKKK